MAVIAAVHGTSMEVAWSVAEKGFVAISKLDLGFYGKGVYFTTCSLYTLPYIASTNHPAIIITYVFPGDPYPVTESHRRSRTLLGRGLVGASISHYVVTRKDGLIANADCTDIYDELVFSQESALLPAFIIEVQKSNFIHLMTNYKRDLPQVNEDLSSSSDDDNSRCPPAVKNSVLEHSKGKEKEKLEIQCVSKAEEPVPVGRTITGAIKSKTDPPDSNSAGRTISGAIKSKTDPQDHIVLKNSAGRTITGAIKSKSNANDIVIEMDVKGVQQPT